MTQINSLQDALTSYKVTFEQVSKVTLIESSGKHFAKVESSKGDGTEYTVEYNPLFRVLTCNCAAGKEGIGCWHRRATLAQIAVDKLETRKAIEAEKEAERSASQVEETAQEKMYRELRAQGTDSSTAYRIAFATPKRGRKAPDYDPTFSLLKK